MAGLAENNNFYSLNSDIYSVFNEAKSEMMCIQEKKLQLSEMINSIRSDLSLMSLNHDFLEMDNVLSPSKKRTKRHDTSCISIIERDMCDPPPSSLSPGCLDLHEEGEDEDEEEEDDDLNVAHRALHSTRIQELSPQRTPGGPLPTWIYKTPTSANKDAISFTDDTTPTQKQFPLATVGESPPTMMAPAPTTASPSLAQLDSSWCSRNTSSCDLSCQMDYPASPVTPMALMQPMLGMTPLTSTFRTEHLRASSHAHVEDDSTPTNPGPPPTGPPPPPPPTSLVDADPGTGHINPGTDGPSYPSAGACHRRGCWEAGLPRRLLLEDTIEYDRGLGVTRTMTHAMTHRPRVVVRQRCRRRSEPYDSSTPDFSCDSVDAFRGSNTNMSSSFTNEPQSSVYTNDLQSSVYTNDLQSSVYTNDLQSSMCTSSYRIRQRIFTRKKSSSFEYSSYKESDGGATSSSLHRVLSHSIAKRYSSRYSSPTAHNTNRRKRAYRHAMMSLATSSSTGLSCCDDFGISFVSLSDVNNINRRRCTPPFAPANSPMNGTPPPALPPPPLPPPPPPPRPIHLGPLPQLPPGASGARVHNCLSRPACVGRESPAPYDYPPVSSVRDTTRSDNHRPAAPPTGPAATTDAPTAGEANAAISASDKRSSFLRRIHNWGRKFRLRTK